MADSFVRMGTFGIVDLGPRTLAESDIAAIRGLYGPAHDTTECCAEINGKLLAVSGKAIRPLRVWAEEDHTGRVMAQTDASVDGTFSLNGLPECGREVAGIHLLPDERNGPARERRANHVLFVDA